jgi:hypothetical protein
MPNFTLNAALTKFIKSKEEIYRKIAELNKAKEKLKELELGIICAMEDSNLTTAANADFVFTRTTKVDEHGDTHAELNVIQLPSLDELEKIEVKEI